jgi:hypothetical protein
MHLASSKDYWFNKYAVADKAELPVKTVEYISLSVNGVVPGGDTRRK